MRIRPSFVLYAAIAVAVLVWALGSLGGDARRIGKRLDRLGALVEKEAGESRLTGLDKARRLGTFFSRDFAVDLAVAGAGTLGDRQQLSRVFFGYRDRPTTIGVAFHDRELTVDEARRQAEMTLLAVVTAGWDGGRSRERYRLRLEWIEEAGEWQIRRLELLEVVEGPRGLL